MVQQEQRSRQPATHGLVTRDSLAELLSEGHADPLLAAFAEGGSPYNAASFEYGLQALIEGCAAALHRCASRKDEVGRSPSSASEGSVADPG